MDGYTVGEVAKLAHISVRALHHYDELGLLTPAGRSPAGYRLYSNKDLHRLQQILFYRELEFSLEEIAAMLADPDVGVDDHLRRQHRLVRERQARNAALLAAIEKEMEARSMGMSLTPEEQFEIFGTDKIAEYQEEAKQKWGDTDAWRESQRRSARYTKEDWIEIKEQAGANIEGFLAAIRAGEPADGPVAMQLAEEHRQHLIRWFYDCGPDMHRGLGDLYISDPRYMAEYDKLAPGFSHYVRDAFHANADRL
ncbi:MerR family transcriptional regulator [Sporichthya brevicatena]|uniref:MerR family transcriptional regulator n=1 Tax=Sporichthya brevicatena TaxID=171442 RepID=A0ABP3SI14_9ACTN